MTDAKDMHDRRHFDPKLPPDQQDKRSVVAIELADLQPWLEGSPAEAVRLVRPPPMEVIDAAPMR